MIVDVCFRHFLSFVWKHVLFVWATLGVTLGVFLAPFLQQKCRSAPTSGRPLGHLRKPFVFFVVCYKHLIHLIFVKGLFFPLLIVAWFLSADLIYPMLNVLVIWQPHLNASFFYVQHRYVHLGLSNRHLMI